jgi:hypothetical protein
MVLNEMPVYKESPYETFSDRLLCHDALEIAI